MTLLCFSNKFLHPFLHQFQIWLQLSLHCYPWHIARKERSNPFGEQARCVFSTKGNDFMLSFSNDKEQHYLKKTVTTPFSDHDLTSILHFTPHNGNSLASFFYLHFFCFFTNLKRTFYFVSVHLYIKWRFIIFVCLEPLFASKSLPCIGSVNMDDILNIAQGYLDDRAYSHSSRWLWFPPWVIAADGGVHATNSKVKHRKWTNWNVECVFRYESSIALRRRKSCFFHRGSTGKSVKHQSWSCAP